LIFVLLLIAGYFQSLQFTATQVMTYADVDQGQMSTASSIASMTQQLSRGFGIAMVAVVLHISMAWHGTATLTRPDFIVAFLFDAVIALSALGFCWNLPHDAASEVSGHKPKAAA
jgi:hypothetical protein